MNLLPTNAYGAEQDVAELRDIQFKIAHYRRQVEQLEAKHDEYTGALVAADRVIETTKPILAGPPQLGITAAARCDKAEAERIIQRVNDTLPRINQLLVGQRALLAQWEEKLKTFDHSRINAARELDALKRRMNQVRSGQW